jgi:hypothetical protein
MAQGQFGRYRISHGWQGSEFLAGKNIFFARSAKISGQVRKVALGFCELGKTTTTKNRAIKRL